MNTYMIKQGIQRLSHLQNTKSLINYPKQNLFFLRRLQNKPLNKESNNQHRYDEDTYIKAMKKFQREARGLVPGSKEYDQIRTKIYNELKEDNIREKKLLAKNSKNTLEKSFKQENIMTADYSQFYVLLVVIPEETECYETVNILNYFGFPFHPEEDNVIKQIVKKDMGFKKDDPYPLLLIDSSSAEMPNGEAVSKNNVLKFLQENEMIGDYRSHSAFEKQGLEFVESEMVSVFNDIYSDFRPLAQFYMTMKHFKKANLNAEVTVLVFQYMWKFYKMFYLYFKNKGNNSGLKKKEKFDKFQEVMDKYISRFEKSTFHGGDIPDAVDFKVYSWLQRFMHTPTMKKLMLARGKSDKLLVWYDKMERICKTKTFM